MKKAIYLVLVLAIIGGIVWLVKTPGKPGAYDSFATCLGEKGAKFYGAFWCPHCQNQKAMFGKSAKLLPYIECSTPDGQGQLPICKDLGINTYPTWHFEQEGTTTPEVLTGEVPLETLAEKTSCTLPVVEETQ